MKSRKDVSAVAKNTMMLSKETRDGLRMTGMSLFLKYVMIIVFKQN